MVVAMLILMANLKLSYLMAKHIQRAEPMAIEG